MNILELDFFGNSYSLLVTLKIRFENPFKIKELKMLENDLNIFL
ncbi:protein of unknown function [Tepidibacter aestuarii]|nr:protein of unknown function [Tepidibacter aestuarii]